MCRVSDKLQLCTCSGNTNSLKHFWAFFRYNPEKDDIIVGLPVLPFNINPEDDAFNRKTLCDLLNQHNTFDNGIEPKEKDRLLISFKIGQEFEDRINYGFEYKTKWEECGYDPFEWYWNHDEIETGKIKTALQRKTRKNKANE